MSRRVKRRKLDAGDMEEPARVVTLRNVAGVVPPQTIIFMDEEELRAWLDSLHETGLQVADSILDRESVYTLMQSLCALLNHRWKTSLKQSILTEFFRCMAKHGIPFRYNLQCRICRNFNREEYPEKYVPTMNLKLFFRDLSRLEYRLRACIWVYHHIHMGMTKCKTPSLLASHSDTSLSALRYQLCHACRDLNYRAVVGLLANSDILRMTAEHPKGRRWKYNHDEIYHNNHMNTMYFDSPLVLWTALQATLAMKHDAEFDICGRLLMLATLQTINYTTTTARNTILMQLCEFLIATLLLGNPSDVSAIIALESRIHRFNRSYENSSVWNAYKLIAEYEAWKKQPSFGGMILNTAQSLAEIAESVPCFGTLFLEAACQIWAKQGRCEDKILDAILKILSKCPQLLGRVIRFLEAINFDHEIEVIIAEVCQEGDDAGLPASDPVWLDWCQPRIELSEKYGRNLEVLSRCAKVLFRFLDYGANRGSTRAWLMLHTAMGYVDPDQLTTAWAERYDWWPQFHTVPLPPEAALQRAEVLAALDKVPVE
ncbi:hypothetical protein KIN20_032137 [Parelaphostrongylus tenuis]|uniref:Uncharacterized protein n=1 Tax=Parelaphostrongylus tenuis TaxID=148309 RepID=A0AAD5R671_PARTN|nr:hypothetical protein KIN20_032137 [Parelaphostrongylus tenuis]